MEKAPLRIWLADDDEADRLIFRDALSELKLQAIVSMLHDGEELMVHLLAKDAVLPDLLFLDLNMPRKNGLECLREIRNQPKLKDMIIVIYSTSASELDIEETFLSGANVYINKPHDFHTLKRSLERAVMMSHQVANPPFSRENFLMRL